MTDRSLGLPILLSIAAAIVTFFMKSLAYYLTGSVGLLSDAAESLINLLAAVAAFLSLWYSYRPIDPSHTYGHEKIEYFSSGLEGSLILAAAVGIAWYAIRRLILPEELQRLEVGLLVTLAASAVNFGVARLLIHVGRKKQSIVLEADGQHLMTDVWTSVAVIAGVGLVWLTGVHLFDPIVALLVSVNIVWTGLGLVIRSFNGLMDHSLPEAEQARVRAAIASCLTEEMAFHALRTRQAGPRRFADFHLLVPGWFSVHKAHHLAERIEERLKAELPGIEVSIHIEPIEEEVSWQDSALLPLEQAARRAERENEGPGK
jgi:cation diffusion facilitator family transporter